MSVQEHAIPVVGVCLCMYVHACTCVPTSMYVHACTCIPCPVQAQQGVQRKQFSHLDDMVEYYSHSRRGLVCALTIPISPKKEEEEEEEEVLDDGDDSGDCHMTSMEWACVRITGLFGV